MSLISPTMAAQLHKLRSVSMHIAADIHNHDTASLHIKFKQLRYIINFYANRLSGHTRHLLQQCLHAINWLLAPGLGVRILYRHAVALGILWCIHVIYRIILKSPAHKFFRYLKSLTKPARVHRRIAELHHIMHHAKSFDEWASAAVEMDKIEHVWHWKDDAVSDIYDYKRIQFELRNFQSLIERNDIAGIMVYARARLMRNVVNINDRRLHTVLRAGTKRLIEQYIYTVVHALQLVCTSNSDTVTSADKLSFFNETRHAFGRSALLLSGGATMALFHTGVVRALFENNLLPRVLSGSSGGAIIASMLATRSDEELAIMLDPSTNAVDFNFFPTTKGTFIRRLQRFWKKGVVLDINILGQCVNANVSQLTFAEAYSKTGRIVNISISPAASSGNKESARICNYLSTPNLLVASACLASCAIPGIYAPVELLCKNEAGEIVPYLESWELGEKIVWEDGSVMSDLPMTRLSELFNVNNYIVSQVNPHIAPFVSAAFDTTRNVDTLLSNPISKLIQFLALQLKDTALNLNRLGVLPLHPSARFVLEQQYMGDVTIVPNLSLNDFQLLLVNPTQDRYAQCQRQTELQTYRQLSTIRGLMEIELCLDESVRRMRGVLILEELSHQKLVYKMSKTASWSADHFDNYYDDNEVSTDSDNETPTDRANASAPLTEPASAPVRTPSTLTAIRESSNDNISNIPQQSLGEAATSTSGASDEPTSLPDMIRRQSSSPAEYVRAMANNNKAIIGSNPRLSQLVSGGPNIDVLPRTTSQPPLQSSPMMEMNRLTSRSISSDYFHSARLQQTTLPVDSLLEERVSPQARHKQKPRNTQSMLKLSQHDSDPPAAASVKRSVSQYASSSASPLMFNNHQNRPHSLKKLLASSRNSSLSQSSLHSSPGATSPSSAIYIRQHSETSSPINSSMISPRLTRAISDNADLASELRRVTSLPHAVSQLELASDCNAVP